MTENMDYKGILKSFWRFARNYKTAYFTAFGLMLLTLAFESIRPFLLDKGIKAIEADNLDSLKQAALFFLLLLSLEYVSRSVFSYLFAMSFLKTINRLRDAVFQHVLKLRMSYFDKEPVGRLLTRTINDCEALGETLRAGIATVFLDMGTMVVMFFVMAALDLPLTGIMVVTAPLVWLLVRWCGEKLKSKFIDVRKALAESNGFMAEGINGVEILQLFGQTDDSIDRYQEINREYRRACITNNFYDAFLYAIIDAVAALVTAAVLFFGFNVRFGVVEIATVVVFISLIDKIFVPIRDFSGKFATIQQAFAALQRILELLESPDFIVPGPKELEGDRLDIRFEKVCFRYGKDAPYVLEDISFEVKNGQVVALVGQTGSGKSTIGKLLTRAYDGYEGHIRVGGLELTELNHHSLRRKVAVVHQEVELFPGSLRDNISMFDPRISEEKIRWAIRTVNAEHMVANLPNGLDFNVRENGGNLSAGQMQLIVFARALAHDAPIVLMDEATASVDSVTEAWIQEAIKAIFKHKTVIIVAHRLSTIAAADHILVLKNGRILEQGTHAQLTAIEDGYYAGLVNASKLPHQAESQLLV